MRAARELALLPRATIGDVLAGRASLVGSRLDRRAERGLVSPVEARVHLGLGYEDLRALERERLGTLAATSRLAKLGVAARALLASTLAGTTRGRPVPKPFVVSAALDNVTVPAALDLVFAAPPRDRARLVCFAHAHTLTLARTDEDLRDDLARADAVLPDGIGIRLAAAILGIRLRANVNGTDLLPLLCARAAEEGVPLALVGGAEGVARDSARALEGRHPGLAVAKTSHGYLERPAREALLRDLRALGAQGRCLVLVGMGSPIQERWARRHLAAIPGITVLTVGGLFDFFAGKVPRAPQAIRELGLEWAFRLAQEPRRLARRYLLGIPRFLGYALGDALAASSKDVKPRRLPPVR